MATRTTVALTMATGVVAVAVGCHGVPQMLSRPVTVQHGGLDCVGAMLVEMGYTITDGDRPTGFIRGERQRLERGTIFFFHQHRLTDILMVSETAFPGSVPQLNVTASQWSAPTQSVELDDDGRTVQTWHGGEPEPSDEALADARQLLERCAGRAVAQNEASVTG